MAEDTASTAVTAASAGADIWERLRLPQYKHDHPPVRNANRVATDQLSPLERLAARITEKVGSMGFFFLILAWTIIWCGYNIVAHYTKPDLHLPEFDPFPAFVAYLLISNVIQILLMPLIMVGQNVQGRHAEIRAELDFEINQKAEKEVTILLQSLEHNTNLTLQLMKHLQCSVDDEMIRAINAEYALAARLSSAQPDAAVNVKSTKTDGLP